MSQTESADHRKHPPRKSPDSTLSKETRVPASSRDAHHRVMSIVAALQQQFPDPVETRRDAKLRSAPICSRLCEVLAASMIADNRSISLKVYAPGGTTSSSQAMSIGLIVTEAS